MKKITMPWVLLLLCLCTKAQQPPANIATSLQKMLNDVIASSRNYSPGVVMRVNLPGRWQWAGAAGKSNIVTNRAAQANDKYRIASITKSFTAIAVLKLANQGKLNLSDNIMKYLPPLRATQIPNATKISIRQCLNHTSGINDFVNSSAIQNLLIYVPTLSINKEVLYAELAKLVPYAAPAAFDSSYYSNSNYLILKDIVEVVSGQSYPAYITANIITPAGLTNTRCAAGSVLTAPFLNGYLPINGQLVDYTNANYDWALGLGDIISNTTDQVKYFERLFTGQLIPQRWVDSMANFNLKKSRLGAGVNYGYGIWTVDLGGCIAKEHGGDVFGYSSLLTYFPDKNAYVAIDFNTYELNGFRFTLRALVCNLLNGIIYGETTPANYMQQRLPETPMPMLLPLPITTVDAAAIRNGLPQVFIQPLTDDKTIITKSVQELLVWPQPARNKVMIDYPAAAQDAVTVTLTNTAGQNLLVQKFNVVKGANTLTLVLPNTAPGLYSVTTNQNGQTRSAKLLVQ